MFTKTQQLKLDDCTVFRHMDVREDDFGRIVVVVQREATSKDGEREVTCAVMPLNRKDALQLANALRGWAGEGEGNAK